MHRAFTSFASLAALLLVGWYGYRVLVQQQVGFPLSAFIEVERKNALPTEPTDWYGRIDYRRLDRDIAAIARRPEMAGLAVAIVEDGDLRFVQTYGVTDKSTGDWVMPHTVFRWASVSKGVAGSFAAKLSEEGKLDLNAPLSGWQTSLKLPGGAQSRITLAQLLSHQTGLTKNSYDRRLEAGDNPEQLRMQLVGAPLKCAPTTCHSYQNIAFDTASEILGQVSNASYSQAVVARLFKRLDMESAKMGMTGLTGAKSWARPHRGNEIRTPVESYWKLPAAAGVNSNIVDMARWMQAQMGSHPRILSDAMLRQAHQSMVDTDPVYGGKLSRSLKQPSYGLGWRSFTYAGRRLVGHSGAVDGFRATMIFDPVADTGVVAMWNNSWGVPFRIPFAVLDSYYGEVEQGWLDISGVPLPEREPAVLGDAR